MKNKNNYSEYNSADTVAVISLYPKHGETYSKGTTGVASYTKNLVTKLSHKAVVFANIIDKAKTYQEENALVVRCFSPNTLSMWVHIMRELRKFSRIKKVLIQLDFSMYGSMIVTGMIIPFLAILRLLGYEPTVVLHHVITNVNHLSGHVGLSNSFKDRVKAHVYNALFMTFNYSLGMVTHKIVILEHALKEKLAQIISPEKIVVIPHAVDATLETVDKITARKKLKLPTDEFVVMFFGYVNWFKGADLFVEYFKDTEKLAGKKVRFVIAGGESPTMKSKGFYRTYFHNVERSVRESKRVSMTGYVAQEDIGDYFSAADLIVFPYRECMCASGVLSLAFSYKTPFIVSDKLGIMFNAPDMQEIMKQIGLTREQVTFGLNKSDAQRVATKVLENGIKKKMKLLAGSMRETRAFSRNVRDYEEVLFTPTPNKQISVAPAALMTHEI